MKIKVSRFLHWLYAHFWALAEAIKVAADDLRAHSGILLSLLGKLAWVIPLVVVPHLFRTFPTFYAGFQAVGPEWAWALNIAALITLDAVALVRRSYGLQMGTLALGMFVWFFLEALAAGGAPRGWLGLPGAPSSYIYLFAALACLFGMVRTGQHHAARVEAENYMIVARQVRADWDEDEARRSQSRSQAGNQAASQSRGADSQAIPPSQLPARTAKT